MVHRVLSLAIAILIVLTGCTTTPAATPTTAAKPTATTPPKAAASPTAATKPAATPAAKAPAGTLIAASPTFGEDTLDPVSGTVTTWGSLFAPMYEGLTGYDKKGNFVPELAESWSISADGLTWTFKIRKGVKFHNGDELTSADVKYSLERLMEADAKSPWSPLYRRNVARVEAPDPSTVLIITKAVDAPFLAEAFGIRVMPKKYIEEKGEAYFRDHPVGTGPYKFVEHKRGVSVEYEAVANHWRVTPEFKQLIIKLIPEESTRMAMLKRGELDVIPISLDVVDEVKAAGFEVRFGTYETQPSVSFQGAYVQSGMPTADLRIRQALSLAINREELGKTFFKGLAAPALIPSMSSYTWGWDPNWKADPYDPAKAKQLLAEAGYPGKFNDPVINMYSVPSPLASWLPQFVQMISGYWEAVGVKTKITPIDAAALTGMTMNKRPPDAKVIGAVTPGSGYNMSNVVYNVFNLYGSTGTAALLQDPAWDALYTQILGEKDEAKRIKLFQEAMMKGHDQYLQLPTVNVKMPYGVSNKVGEWTAVDFAQAWAYEGIKRK